MATEPGVLRLHRAAPLVVHVIANRAPLAGARVTIGMLAETTNEAGVATIRGRSREPYVFDGIDTPAWRLPPITASHPAAGASRAHSLPDGDAVVDLLLLGTGTIDGLAEVPVTAASHREHGARVSATARSTSRTSRRAST